MTTDLTDAVLEAILDGHTQGSSMGDPYCRECMTDWPCDLVGVVTALRSLRSWADGAKVDLGGYEDAVKFLKAQRDASDARADEARADNARLAEKVAAVKAALDRYVQDDTDPPQCEPEDSWRLIRDVLAALADPTTEAGT